MKYNYKNGYSKNIFYLISLPSVLEIAEVSRWGFMEHMLCWLMQDCWIAHKKKAGGGTFAISLHGAQISCALVLSIQISTCLWAWVKWIIELKEVQSCSLSLEKKLEIKCGGTIILSRWQIPKTDFIKEFVIFMIKCMDLWVWSDFFFIGLLFS